MSECSMVNGRPDAPLPQLPAEGGAVIPLIHARAFRSADSFPDEQTVERRQCEEHIMHIGFGGNGDKRQTVAVGQNAPF